MQNVEFKAELRDLGLARAQCRAVGAKLIGILDQIDTYYKLPDGRLKRRETSGEPTEWIFYHRTDHLRPRLSTFTILSDEQARTRWGTHSLREWLTVRKRRELWMLENIRIHLDEVQRLGTFLEFEGIVNAPSDIALNHEKIAQLRQDFGPVLGEPIGRSYSDLMAAEADSPACE